MNFRNNSYVKGGKWALLTVVGMGTTKIVKDIVETNVTPENVRQKVAVKVATYGIAAAAAFVVKKRLDKEIDGGLKFVQNIFEMIDSVMEGDVDEEPTSEAPVDLDDKTDANVVALAA